MVNSSQECVCVRRQVNASCCWLQLQYRADERWVLVGEAIMFLACPSTCFDVVDATDPRVPFGFECL